MLCARFRIFVIALRLPSFSGHPISTDLVSVGEDVHCEFVKEKYTPEYRQEAARLVIESGRPIAHAAQRGRCSRRPCGQMGQA